MRISRRVKKIYIDFVNISVPCYIHFTEKYDLSIGTQSHRKYGSNCIPMLTGSRYDLRIIYWKKFGLTNCLVNL